MFLQFILKSYETEFSEGRPASKPLQMCRYLLYSLFLENVYSDRFSPMEKDQGVCRGMPPADSLSMIAASTFDWKLLSPILNSQ